MQKVLLNILIKLILWKLIFIIITDGYNISNQYSFAEHRVRQKRDETPDILKIKYHDGQLLKLIVLSKVKDTTLVTHLVPIWSIEDDGEESDQHPNDSRLHPIFYHGVYDFSALTYFPHSNTLHGVIGYKYYIDHLPISNVDDPDIVDTFIHPMSDELSKSRHSRSIQQPDELKRIKRMTGKRKYNMNIQEASTSTKKFKGNRHHGDGSKTNLYPEVLLVVDVPPTEIDDTIPNKYDKVKMYAMSYWNAIDMLFRRIKRVNVKINIAGIVIGKNEDLVAAIIPNPTHYRIDNSHVFIVMNEALDNLGSHFCHTELMKRDSYDFIIWMTSTTLIGYDGLHQGSRDLGISTSPAECGGMHDDEKYQQKILNCAIVMHDNKYSEYHTAARELAHLMYISNDDVLISQKCHQFNCLSSDPLTLSSGIMDPSNKRLDGCLEWSYCAEIHFDAYAKSKASCCLRNYPIRSLGWPGFDILPVSVSVEDQCKCYELRPHDQENYKSDICDKILKCKNEDDQYREIGMPLDGTPCVINNEDGFCNHNECV